MTKFKQPAKLSFILMAAFYVTAAFLASCNNPEGSGGKGGDNVCVPNPKDSSALARIDHFLPEGKINEYKAAYKVQNDSLERAVPSFLLPASEAFNKPAILEILKDPKCVGIRIYHGVKTGGKRNEVRLILVGVDSEGKDLLISNGSAAAAQINSERGGVEQGQCPTCQTGNNN